MSDKEIYDLVDKYLIVNVAGIAHRRMRISEKVEILRRNGKWVELPDWSSALECEGPDIVKQALLQLKANIVSYSK